MPNGLPHNLVRVTVPIPLSVKSALGKEKSPTLSEASRLWADGTVRRPSPRLSSHLPQGGTMSKYVCVSLLAVTEACLSRQGSSGCVSTNPTEPPVTTITIRAQFLLVANEKTSYAHRPSIATLAEQALIH